MGESITLGIIGGLVGVGLGFIGAKVVEKVAHPLTASVGPTTGSATPGGARSFAGMAGAGSAAEAVRSAAGAAPGVVAAGSALRPPRTRRPCT